MRYLLHYILLAVVAVTLCSAAGAPKVSTQEVDLEAIKQATQDPSSPMYYPTLMARFERHDTVMTVEEYRNLYLGTMFQEDYNPYRRSIYEKKVAPLAHKANHTRSELDSLIKYTQLVLRDTPFDINQINFLIYALRAKKKFNMANVWQYRLNHLLEAIVSTGNGQDSIQAWYVIYPRDEASIVNLRVKDVQSIAPTFVAPYYDRIDVTPARGSMQSFYFNLRPVLEEFNRKNP